VPFTWMFPAHVPVNVTFALVVLTGATVYFTLPQPVGGVEAVADDHEPAKTSMLTAGLGEVGLPFPSFLLRSNRLHAESELARTTTAPNVRCVFMSLFIGGSNPQEQAKMIHNSLPMDLGLEGKVAMVAGASRGLGFAVAAALAREGAKVSIASRDEAAIRSAAENIGGGALATAVDVRSADAIVGWAQRTEETFGGIDLLFTNSGGPPAGLALSFDDRVWQDTVDLLLFSTLRMIRAVVPSMQARGGGAILVSTSASVKEPIPNLGLSTVVRASVSALAKTLALELAASGIRVNQIVPGRIDTDRVRQLDEINAKKQGITPAEAKAKAIGAIPLGRYGETEEFGRVGAFLLSPAAAYMTGATVQVDGGLIRSVL
jgi:3-oxoacyl-[acyl-carrier protein] reductase